MKKVLFVLFNTVLLVACSGRSEFIPPSPNDDDYAPPKIEYKSSKLTGGSLFIKDVDYSLFTDTRAFQVGDILMVSLDEETKSNKNAGTSFGKESGSDFSANAIVNLPIYSGSGSAAGDNSMTRDFKGSSSSSQTNSLSGYITVTVYEVLPNGALRIRGEKWLTLNQGDEFIRVTGIVRVEDIQSDNSVSSQRIADARITYAGRGALADANAAGWFTQLLTSPWFPL